MPCSRQSPCCPVPRCGPQIIPEHPSMVQAELLKCHDETLRREETTTCAVLENRCRSELRHRGFRPRRERPTNTPISQIARTGSSSLCMEDEMDDVG